MIGKSIVMDQLQILSNVPKELKEKLKKCLSIGIFVGAGVSVNSGIATFRGAGASKYFQGQNPIYLSSIKGFSSFPKIAWEYFRCLHETVKEAKPNLAHQILASWQKEAEKRRIVKLNLLTTNFDGLLELAGAKAEEIHGNIKQAICFKCKTIYPMQEVNLVDLPPLCRHCGSILLPDVALLDGFIKKSHYDLCVDITRGCSVYILIGTSGVNSHCFGFMKSVKLRPYTTLVEINPRPSHLTKDMHYVIRGNAEDILPQFEYSRF
jgi:NAD-dependent deacetylase